MKQIEYYKKKSSVTLEDKLARDINEDINKNFILLNDVSFSYKNNQKGILKNINLSIEKGKIVGITGETGSGKSTLFHIMLGLLPPKNGMVSSGFY